MDINILLQLKKEMHGIPLLPEFDMGTPREPGDDTGARGSNEPQEQSAVNAYIDFVLRQPTVNHPGPGPGLAVRVGVQAENVSVGDADSESSVPARRWRKKTMR